MATRSVQITLVNNTSSTLTQYQYMLCHGYFLNNSPPPLTVAPNETVQWEADSHDPGFEGTEGWVKYTLAPQPSSNFNAPATSELVFIYWQLPYFPPTNPDPYGPLTTITSVSDVDCNTQGNAGSPYCSVTTPGVWPAPIDNNFTNLPPPGMAPVTQLGTVLTGPGPDQFDIGDDPVAVTWNIISGWPIILAHLTENVNLSFGIVLGQTGSIDQRIRHFYDGSKGLRALAVASHQPSLRKLFGM